jgi:hypothetical protein
MEEKTKNSYIRGAVRVRWTDVFTRAAAASHSPSGFQEPRGDQAKMPVA